MAAVLLPYFIEQTVEPVAANTMLRPAVDNVPEVNLRVLDDACTVFTDTFLRGAVT